MIDQLKSYTKEHPIQFLLITGFILRLIAAFTSHGYYAYDDYFRVVDIAWGWTNGENTDNWFVDDFSQNESLRNILYPGFIAGVLMLSKAIGIVEPFYQMIVVQLFHAVYSLSIIYFVYKITLYLSNQKIAFTAGLIMACMWLFPFLSVRTLVEWTCIPPVLFAYYLYYKNRDSITTAQAIAVGLLLGLAFTVRFQTAFLTLGFGIAMLVHKEWKLTIWSALGFLIVTGITQGIGDYYVCNMPFGKLIEYIDYNLQHSSDYLSRPFFDYLAIIPGVFLPPIGLFIFICSFKNWKKHLHIFLAMFLFLFFHSIFENKQERFIFPILPLILILGTIGLEQLFTSNFWNNRPKLIKGFWVAFWVLNTYTLIFMTTNYTKKSKIETMRFLRSKGPVASIIIENTERGGYNPLPEFYLGARVRSTSIVDQEQLENVKQKKDQYANANSFILFEVKPEQELNIDRLKAIKEIFPNMVYQQRIEGGIVDNFRFKLNPVVKNYEYEIYSTH